MWSEVMKNGTALLESTAATRQSRLDLSALEPGVPFRLTNVSWGEYEGFLEIIGNRHYRTGYSNGEYEIFMPLLIHEIWTAVIGRFIEALASELKRPMKSAGATTLRREDLAKGLEPDRSYYLDNEPLMRNKVTLDLSVDPPPDLALEAEVTSSVEKRMPIYAALRIPEVWRYDGSSIKAHQLTENGVYVVAERSRFFPFLPLDALSRFLGLYGSMSETDLIDSFREWVREQIAAGWKKA
jgi:Uma2 family endonuclease